MRKKVGRIDNPRGWLCYPSRSVILVNPNKTHTECEPCKRPGRNYAGKLTPPQIDVEPTIPKQDSKEPASHKKLPQNQPKGCPSKIAQRFARPIGSIPSGRLQEVLSQLGRLLKARGWWNQVETSRCESSFGCFLLPFSKFNF